MNIMPVISEYFFKGNSDTPDCLSFPNRFLFRCPHVTFVGFCFVQTCSTSPTCVGKWPSSASSRQSTDSGRTSSAHSTSQRETSHACRCICFSPCCTFAILYISLKDNILYVRGISVFREPPEWGGDPGAVPAASWAGCQCDGTRPAPGVLPPHGLQPFLPPHPPQCHARVQHRYRSVTILPDEVFSTMIICMLSAEQIDHIDWSEEA